MIVLVTGAAGFVGRAVVAAFADAGHTVRAGVNRMPLPPALAEHPAVSSVPCRLEDGPSVAAAARGVDAIVHAAYGGAPDRLMADVEALAAHLGAVKTLVTLSSIDVYGEASGTVTEETPPVPPLLPYGAGKRASEAALARLTREGCRSVALRIGCVVGRGSALWVDGLAERIALGAIGDLGPAGEGFAPIIDNRDLADLVVRAAVAEGAGHHVLNAVGDGALRWNGYFAALADAKGIALPRRPAASSPLAALVLPAKAWRKAKLPGFSALAAVPREGERRLFARQAHYDCARAAALGWQPRYDAAAAIRDAI
ncbi:MAG: NAD(P)-dependent oxidoreductase [Pseudomonadota bacterium]